ncbi:MAG: 1-acyl-sn-glycerol-3-phosphate acyltransferase, partial [Clostridia bacterium]|nr:1-acyl-sn-glycerol-3-phosphate acyltransferase [Clostridia bacterium]
YVNEPDKVASPFILLCNHNAFQDFYVAFTLLKKKFSNFIVAIDGYIGREWLLRDVGCICKRKFTNDPVLIKKLKKVLDRGDVPVIYPEARYSLCGTTAVLPASLGKMIKLFKVPVLTLICHGHHVNSPFWDTSHARGVEHTEAEFTRLLTKEEIASLSVDEINDKIVNAFRYDDFKWQKERGIKINDEKRADGLDKVLYQCPHCHTEYEMSSDGKYLICNACGKKWEMTELGELKAVEGETEFSHIPDWYEWERENVRKEVRNGTYSTGVMPVTVESLPNAKKFIPLGKGEMIHDKDGFRVKIYDKNLSDTTEINLSVLDTYSVHIEYRYLFKHGDCVDLNTMKDTWYIYPENCKFSITKMALATEELYFYEREKQGKPCRKGLA